MIRKIIHDGDLVLRRRPNAKNVGKLQPKSEGPYLAKATGRPRSFYLTNGGGTTITHTWNINSSIGFTSKCKKVASMEL